MSLHLVGIDPDTKTGDSSTVWFDDDTREFVFQGWKADVDLRRRITQTPAPGHAPGIPDHEDVIRMPARMVEVLRKACDVAERAELG
ncbi:hypothetical protein [Streptacidiphilus sp. EB129]|uniref:hypothetical protein n=1 Tax=Streptacidiphilus sp. EB129 TaxID=3156262 RepID=UPI0035172472